MIIHISEAKIIDHEYAIDNVENGDDIDTVLDMIRKNGKEISYYESESNIETGVEIKCKECGNVIREEFWIPGVEEILIIVDTDKKLITIPEEIYYKDMDEVTDHMKKKYPDYDIKVVEIREII